MLGIRCVGLKDVGGKRVYQAKRVSRSKQAGDRVFMKKWLVFVGKKEEEAKKPSVDRRQWLVHGGGIPQLHVGGTIACRAAAEGQRYQRKQRTTTWRGRPHWVDGRCCHFGQGHIGPAP